MSRSRRKRKTGKRIIQVLMLLIGVAIIALEMVFILSDFGSQSTKKVNVVQETIQTGAETVVSGTKEEADTIRIFTKYVLVGDSRYVGMSSCAQLDDVFIAQNSMGYNYLMQNMEYIKSISDEFTAVVIGLGVNDFGYNKENYIKAINEMAETMDAQIYFVTVNPVDEDKEAQHGYSTTNDAIDQYNKEMIRRLSSKVMVIDTNSYLKQNGYVTSDGLHYTQGTYQLIYNVIKDSI